jgi:serine/threonine-protein kinase
MALAAKEASTLTPGTVLDGRFRIERHLATGGMGDIYRAEHIYMKRRVALKLLRPEWADQSEMSVRFQREGELVSQLDHPQIVRVFDFGCTSEGLFFLAMELIEGQSLEELLQLRGALPPRLVAQILKPIAAALQEAHRCGIMHRDLKPDNILLAPRQDAEAGGCPFAVKVLDFGLARMIEPDEVTRVTRAGLVLGTPAYLSPEQALGQSIDHRADLYSLSVIGYRMLAGRLPFVSENPRELFDLHAGGTPPTLVSLRPELSNVPELTALIERGLSKDPQQRPPSAEAYGEELERGMPPLTTTMSGPVAAISLQTVAGELEGGKRKRQTRRILLPSKRRRSQNLTIMALKISPERDRDARGDHLTTLAGKIAPIVRGYGGRLTQSNGSSGVVVFTAPTDALHCATALQDFVFEGNGGLTDAEQLSLRIGVNLGEVILARGQVSGEPLELTERLEEVTEGGDVCFTEAVYLAMNRSQVRSETIGVKALPGVDHPVKLYRVMREAGGPDALPYGGRALVPLRPRLTGRDVPGLIRGGALRSLRLTGAAGRWLVDGVVRGTPLRRAAILWGFALLVGGMAFGTGRLSTGTPSAPPAPVAATADKRSYDEVIGDLKRVHGCTAQLRDTQRLEQIADKRSEAILRSLSALPVATLESADCEKVRVTARRALGKLTGADAETPTPVKRAGVR